MSYSFSFPSCCLVRSDRVCRKGEGIQVAIPKPIEYKETRMSTALVLPCGLLKR